MISNTAKRQTIKERIMIIWKTISYGQEFNGVKFARSLKQQLNMMDKNDDTFLRQLRKLREERKINYVVKDKMKSLYAKIKEESEKVTLKSDNKCQTYVKRKRTIFNR